MIKNNNINDLSPSDLINLFVDGEATEAEKSVLFRELSIDSQLQNELQNAISVKNTAFQEVNNTVVPSAVSNKIFSAVGIGSAAIAPLAITGAKSSIFKISILYSVISALIGSLLTYFLMNSLFNNNLDNNKTSESKLYQNADANLSMIKDTVFLTDTIYKDRIIVKNVEKQFENNIPPVIDLTKTEIKPETVIEQQIVSKQNINSESIKLNSIITADTLNSILNNTVTINSIYNNNFWSRLLLNLNSINAIKYLPARDGIFAEQPLINNFSLGIKYQLTDKIKTGFTIGKESYPIYLKESDENIYPVSSLTYYGVNFDYNMLTLSEEYDIDSEVRLLLGASKIGFYGKAGLGIIWFPYYHLGLNFGLESTISISSFNKKEDLTGKIGFYYGISYRF
ncbi:MAG TPA: hypothetical protein PKY56_03735 [Candidatus Kapabacteria bacterium]|nr:hypothetical protein [Candidatus Kapabacteria bacterium]HPO62490.1 hypothetical protein [Candidatus Kapabacteria bacterium]